MQEIKRTVRPGSKASKWANTGYGAGALVAPHTEDLLGCATFQDPKDGAYHVVFTS